MIYEGKKELSYDLILACKNISAKLAQIRILNIDTPRVFHGGGISAGSFHSVMIYWTTDASYLLVDEARQKKCKVRTNFSSHVHA